MNSYVWTSDVVQHIVAPLSGTHVPLRHALLRSSRGRIPISPTLHPPKLIRLTPLKAEDGQQPQAASSSPPPLPSGTLSTSSGSGEAGASLPADQTSSQPSALSVGHGEDIDGTPSTTSTSLLQPEGQQQGPQAQGQQQQLEQRRLQQDKDQLLQEVDESLRQEQVELPAVPANGQNISSHSSSSSSSSNSHQQQQDRQQQPQQQQQDQQQQQQQHHRLRHRHGSAAKEVLAAGKPKSLLHRFPVSSLPSPALAAFVAGGALMSFALLHWARGTPMRRNHPYYVSISFEHASKIQEGTPVRMKGVQVGAVSQVSIYPSHVEVVAEVMDSHNVIPRSSRVDINQLGLAADPFVDITPPLACSTHLKGGPHDPQCSKEGLIVCNGGKLEGSQGGSMDYMMKVYLSRQDYSRVKVVEGDYRQM